jgi:hypothetical protein
MRFLKKQPLRASGKEFAVGIITNSLINGRETL